MSTKTNLMRETDYVTRGEFRVFKGEMYEFKDEMNEFREEVKSIVPEISKEFQRHSDSMNKTYREDLRAALELVPGIDLKDVRNLFKKK